MKVITNIMIAGAMSILASAAVADGKNWSDEKSERIETNRESDAGRGNGGERYLESIWTFTLFGEDGPMDRDPGASEDKNKACSGGDFIATSC